MEGRVRKVTGKEQNPLLTFVGGKERRGTVAAITQKTFWREKWPHVRNELELYNGIHKAKAYAIPLTGR